MRPSPGAVLAHFCSASPRALAPRAGPGLLRPRGGSTLAPVVPRPCACFSAGREAQQPPPHTTASREAASATSRSPPALARLLSAPPNSAPVIPHPPSAYPAPPPFPPLTQPGGPVPHLRAGQARRPHDVARRRPLPPLRPPQQPHRRRPGGAAVLDVRALTPRTRHGHGHPTHPSCFLTATYHPPTPPAAPVATTRSAPRWTPRATSSPGAPRT